MTTGVIIRLPSCTLIGPLDKLLLHPGYLTYHWPYLRLTLRVNDRTVTIRHVQFMGDRLFHCYDGGRASTCLPTAVWRCFAPVISCAHGKIEGVAETNIVNFFRKQVGLRQQSDREADSGRRVHW